MTVCSPELADDLGRAVDGLVAVRVDVIAALRGDGTQRAVTARLAGTPPAVVPGGRVNLLASRGHRPSRR